MDYTNQRLLDMLPIGSEVIKIYTDPINNSSLLIDYLYEGKSLIGEIKRTDLNKLVDYDSGKYFYLTNDLTINKLYELYSIKHNLDLIKNEDYVDDESPVDKVGNITLVISDTSLRYIPGVIAVEIINPDQVLISDEKTRNLTGLKINPFKESLEKELFKLGTILFNGLNFTCFNKNLLTLDFRNFIISKISDESKYKDSMVNEILTSKIINCVNDELSDVLFLSGTSNIIFLIRFTSKADDLPVLI